jgi:hypothetical protein
MADTSSTQDASHLPQPVQASECTVGRNMVCLPVRSLCCKSSVMALSITGQTR